MIVYSFYLDFVVDNLLNRYAIVFAILVSIIIMLLVKNDRLKKKNSEINMQMHHRIKNNMQLVSSLINLQLKYSLDDHVLSILNESKSRFHVLNILNKTIINQGISDHIHDTSVFLEKIIASNLNHYKHEKSRVSIDIDVLLGDLSVEKAIALGLITNELFLFVFKNNLLDGDDNICFTLKQCPQNESYFLQFKNKTVEGNWINRYSKTLSEQIISRLTNQLQSEVEIDDTESMEFSFSFK